MNFTKDIKNNSLLIVPSNIKDNILDRIDEENRLINIKIVSFNELKKELLFSLDDEASLFLMDKYKLKKEVAEEYLNNLLVLITTICINSPSIPFIHISPLSN